MSNRRLKPEVQEVFERYIDNSHHVRRLSRERALHMLRMEFALDEQAARSVFEYFDTDRNGSLSLWEFQHFCSVAGPRVAETAALFERLDTRKRRLLDRHSVVKILKDMRSVDGQQLEDNDVEMILKSARDQDQLSLGDFIVVLYRVNTYRKSFYR